MAKKGCILKKSNILPYFGVYVHLYSNKYIYSNYQKSFVIKFTYATLMSPSKKNCIIEVVNRKYIHYLW